MWISWGHHVLIISHLCTPNFKWVHNVVVIVHANCEVMWSDWSTLSFIIQFMYIYILHIINHYYIKATSSSSQATGGLGSESKGMTTCATEWPSVRGSILGCNFHWKAVHPVSSSDKKTNHLWQDVHWQDVQTCPKSKQPMAIHGPHRWSQPQRVVT